MIPFAPWRPDAGSFDLNYSADVRNVVPDQDGFAPFQSFVSDNVALASAPRGVMSARSKTGIPVNIMATRAKLYSLASSGTAWTDVTRSAGGDYTTAEDGFWTFTKFGERIIAGNGVDATQYFEVGVSTNFLPLPNAPVAQFMGRIGEFVIALKLAGGFNKAKWSGIGNSEQWTISATTLSDEQEFAEGGNVTGFVSGELSGVVFQESSIKRMTYQGPPLAFRFDDISLDMGCRLERTIASSGEMTFFLGDDGFYMLTGNSLVPIGYKKVDKWIEKNLDVSRKHLVSSVVDPVRRMYLLSFPMKDSLAGNNKVIGYHWPTQEWAPIDGEYSIIYRQVGSSTFTTVDTWPGGVDDVPDENIDAGEGSGAGRPNLAAVDSTLSKGLFSGPNMEAYVETKDFQAVKARKALLRSLRVMIEGEFTEPLVNVKGRDSLNEPHEDYGPTEITRYGTHPTRVNARYHRVGVTVPAGGTWEYLRGIDDLKASVMGQR